MTQTYSALAPIYDRIMSHVEYDQWVLYIKNILAQYGEAPAPHIFEIGGGTGLLGLKLAAEGFAYTGSDLSFSMCRQARLRGMPFFAADACFLPLKKKAVFDSIIFLYDGINYLPTIDVYPAVFEQIHAHLNPRGLFLFDITTIANSLENFSEFLDAGNIDGHFYFRRSYFHDIESMQYNDFTIFKQIPNGPHSADGAYLYQKSFEHHAQKVFHVKTIKAAVPEELFDIVGIWDSFSFKRYSSGSERVHFLLKKKSP
jgi:Predicted methyltransferase (contains TPR repeat)